MNLDYKNLPVFRYMSRTQLRASAYFLMLTLAGILGGTLLTIAIFAFYAFDLPNPNRLIDRKTELSTKFFDRNGVPLYEIFAEENRTLVTLPQVSENIIHATLSAEDADFYLHNGFSFTGMLRAVKNTLTGAGLQGGSTLTQQVVKNSLLTQERTLSRKIKEFILSLQVENNFSKETIIQMYLNETPYGGQNYGIYAAAKTFFDKHPSELTIAESAYLAGLPQRPSYYSYFGQNPDAGIERKNYVLYLMNVRGWTQADGKRYFLSNEEYEKAKNEELNFQTSSLPFKAPHFVFYAKQFLANIFGDELVEQGGLQVTTTLDSGFQDKAEEIVLDEVTKAKYLGVGNGGAVVLQPTTGQVLAMVGSKGYFLKSEPDGCISGITGAKSCTFEPNVNVTLSTRQPGSTIKPLTYSLMLSQGYTAAYPFLDVATKFPGATLDKPYEPVNYDGKFRGPMSLRKSLGNSINISAVKSLQIVGVDNLINLAEKLGIKTFTDRSRFGLSLTLGGGETKLLEMTNAFATFANKGVHIDPNPILEVKDPKGNILYKANAQGEKVMGEDVAFLVSDILADDGARSEVFGAGSLLNIPKQQVAVKTGTTDDKRDNYALGYTPSVTIGVWVGNNNNDKMNPILASGITGATPIWRKLMMEFLKDKPAEKFVPPENVKKMVVDKLTGMLPFEDEDTREEWFVKGTEPSAKSPWYQKLEICKVDNKLASNACKDAGKTKVKTFIKMYAELPIWQADVDKWVQENYGDEEKYFPPTTQSRLEFDGDKVKDSDTVYVDFSNLKDGDTIPLSFRLGVEVSASNDIDAVRIYKNGEQVTKDSSYPYGYNFLFSPNETGEYDFKAVAQDSKGNKGEKTIKLKVVSDDLR